MRHLNIKSFLLIAYFAFISINSMSAQKVYFWLDAGLKMSGGSGMFYNNNLINDRSITPKFASAYGIGGKFGFNFGEYHALTIDAFYNSVNQTNELKSEIITLTQKKVSLNAVDLYLMYRYNRNMNYIEMGAKYSFIQQFRSATNGTFDPNSRDFFIDNNISPVLGFGYYMFNADAFTANLGLRLSYGLYDILNANGKEANYFISPLPAYENPVTTNLATIEIVLELNFGLGQYAKSVCGKRASFMSM